MVHAILYTGVALFLLTWLGNQICRGILNLSGLKDAVAGEPEPSHVAGRIVGTLERLILASGILVQSWEIIAAVIALKTVARFQKLDKREFAEYFLVGSLFSLFWSMLVTSAWLAYDHRVGFDLRQKAVATLGFEDKADDRKDRSSTPGPMSKAGGASQQPAQRGPAIPWAPAELASPAR